MKRDFEPLEPKPEPLILATEPDEVMWNTVLFTTLLMAVLFLFVHGI